MAQRIRSVMTSDPVTLPTTSSVAEAARAMRDANIGDIIVLDGKQTCGILTDRDIVVRGVAEGRNLATTVEPWRYEPKSVCHGSGESARDDAAMAFMKCMSTPGKAVGHG